MNFDVKKFLSNFYIVDYFKKLVRTGNIGTMIYLAANLVLYILLFGGFIAPEIIPFALLCYVLSVVIALSPVGEFILRVQSGCKKLKKFKKRTPEIEQRLVPIFNRVHQRARELDPSISPKVQLFVARDNDPNAFATGRKTVCVTTGLLNYTDEQIEGILAHEFGHIAHRDTDTMLVIAVGNFLISILFFVFRLIVNMMIYLVGSDEKGRNVITTFIVQILVDFILVTLMRIWLKIGVLFTSHSSRQNEFEADKFACELGYKTEIYNALDAIDGGSGKSAFFTSLTASHPDTDDRLDHIHDFDQNTLHPNIVALQVQQGQITAQQAGNVQYTQPAPAAPAAAQGQSVAFSDIANKETLGEVFNQLKKAPAGMAAAVQKAKTYMPNGANTAQTEAPAPVAPIPAPAVPIPAPVAPIPAPVAPMPAPVAPIPAPVAPIPAPAVPMAAPAAFSFPKPFQANEKLFAQYGQTGYLYYATMQTIQNGQADVVFFDGVRQWVPTAMLMRLSDIGQATAAEANWNKQGTFYPCSIAVVMEDEKIEVIYGDARTDVLTLNEIRLQK